MSSQHAQRERCATTLIPSASAESPTGILTGRHSRRRRRARQAAHGTMDRICVALQAQ